MAGSRGNVFLVGLKSCQHDNSWNEIIAKICSDLHFWFLISCIEKNSSCYCYANLALPCLMPQLRLYETQTHHPKIWKLQSFTNFPALLCFEILQMLETPSVHIFSGGLNVEWAVRPHSKSLAAMPDEAKARTFVLSNLILLIVNLLEIFYLCLQGHLKKYLPFITINWWEYYAINILCSGFKRYSSWMICKSREWL